MASIQKRTSLIKFAHLAEKSGNGSISNRSTKVLELARAAPDLFAAIAPLAPCYDWDRIPALADGIAALPVQILHARDDTECDYEISAALIDALRKRGCPDARMYDRGLRGHNGPGDAAFEGEWLLEWLLRYRRVCTLVHSCTSVLRSVAEARFTSSTFVPLHLSKFANCLKGSSNCPIFIKRLSSFV